MKLKGDGSKTTKSNGVVKFTLAEGRQMATASKSGYASATVRVRIRWRPPPVAPALRP